MVLVVSLVVEVGVGVLLSLQAVRRRRRRIKRVICCFLVGIVIVPF